MNVLVLTRRLQKSVACIVKTLAADMLRADLLKQAGAMAYVSLISLVPSLAATFIIISMFKPLLGEGGQLTLKLRSFIIENLAQGTGNQVIATLDQMINKLNLARVGATSFAGLLVTLVILLRQIENAFNRIWQIRQDRNAITRFIYFWTFLTLGTTILSITIGAVSGFKLDEWLTPRSLNKVPEIIRVLSSSLSWWFFFFLLYKVVPNCRVPWKNAAIGAIVAAILFQCAGFGFRIYVTEFSAHRAIYGAMAALPLFLTWIYICWVVSLLGAVITWRTQEGFPKEEAAKSGSDILSSPPSLVIFQERIKSLAPLFVLTEIHLASRASPKGITLMGLSQRLQLPPPWISLAIDALIEWELVIKTHSESELSLSGEESFFPSQSAVSLSCQKIAPILLPTVREVLNQYPTVILPSSLEQYFKTFQNTLTQPEASFNEFLDFVVETNT